MRATSLRSSEKPRHSAIIFGEPVTGARLHGRSRCFLRPAALNPLRFVARVAMRMRDIGLARTASSLSFTTLLAVVPMATIALAFVARFPMFESWFAALEAFVFKNMLPGSAASVIHEYVLGFAEQAARLTGVSIVLIAATAGLAISTVEREINLIWGIRRPVLWRDAFSFTSSA